MTSLLHSYPFSAEMFTLIPTSTLPSNHALNSTKLLEYFEIKSDFLSKLNCIVKSKLEKILLPVPSETGHPS